MTAEIAAGGGVVWDRGHVLVVHRPRYDDWTLPKGKLDPVDGGDIVACAVREVREEAGVTVEVGSPAGRTRYSVAGPGGGAAVKVVDYWHMERTGGNFRPNREVDSVRWLPVAEAQATLTYDRDRLLLEGAAPGRTSARGVFGRFAAAVGRPVDMAAVLGPGFVLHWGERNAGAVELLDGLDALVGATFTDVEAGPGATVAFVAHLAPGDPGVPGRATIADASIAELFLDDET